MSLMPVSICRDFYSGSSVTLRSLRSIARDRVDTVSRWLVAEVSDFLTLSSTSPYLRNSCVTAPRVFQTSSEGLEMAATASPICTKDRRVVSVVGPAIMIQDRYTEKWHIFLSI